VVQGTKQTEQQAQGFINNLHMQYETEKAKNLEEIKKKRKHLNF